MVFSVMVNCKVQNILSFNSAVSYCTCWQMEQIFLFTTEQQYKHFIAIQSDLRFSPGAFAFQQADGERRLMDPKGVILACVLKARIH